MRCIDMVGQRFGKLIVVSRAENDKKGQARWLCQCDCGGSTITTRYNLITGQTKSCGCILRSPRTTELDRRLSGVHSNMKARCSNPNNPNYKYYGGRGITVCEEWQHIDKFREWATITNISVNTLHSRLNILHWSIEKALTTPARKLNRKKN